MNNISIALSVMNRTDRILQCLLSWYDHSIFNDIILVDWSSSPPVIENKQIKNFVSSKNNIRIIRVDNEKYFSQPAAYNIAINNCKNDYILKLDIDHILIDDNFPIILENITKNLDNSFYCGEDSTPEHFGIVFFSKRLFDSVNGYDERLTGWGGDDNDIYFRMSKINTKIMMTKIPDYIYHNPHDDNLRVANYEIKNKWESLEKNKKLAREKY
jgi:predicted glycosyltransferase involved in capsule biosynthesis